MGFEYLAGFAADVGMDILTDKDSSHIELTLNWLVEP